MLQCGEYRTLAELADAEGIRLSYVCRVVRLMLLAPEIVDRILDGRTTAGLTRFLKAAPAVERASYELRGLLASVIALGKRSGERRHGFSMP
jgi:hypothetical protein